MSNSGSPDMVYCRDCGSEIRARAEICPECGIRQQQPDHGSGTTEKDPGLAAAASFVIPGLGQVYNGEILKGFIAGTIVIGLAITVIGLIVAIPIWIWLVYDAYKTADAAGSSPADRSSRLSSQNKAEQVDEAILEVLEWYKSQTTGAGLVEETRRQYRMTTSMDDLSDPDLDCIATALEEYQAERGADENIQTAQEIIREERQRRASEQTE